MSPSADIPASAPAPQNRPVVLFYVADQVKETTSSVGIFHYTRDLVHELLATPNPGFKLVLLLNDANREEMLPAGSLPAWVCCATLPSPRGIFPRLWYDHVTVLRHARAHRACVICYPKGWTSLWRPRGTRTCAVVHDDILGYYRRQYPGYFSGAKVRYFRWMFLHTLRRADQVWTISETSRQALEAYRPSRKPACTTIGGGLAAPPRFDSAAWEARRGLLVIGSRLPHKGTAETLHLLRTWADETGFPEPIYVSGRLPPELTRAYETDARFRFEGFLSNDAFFARMAQVRALVLLSEIEGFGLPLLEAYSSGTPVVYRDAHSFAEIMGPACPGAWSGDASTFAGAMAEALALQPDRVQAIRDRLLAANNWPLVVARLRQGLEALLPMP